MVLELHAVLLADVIASGSRRRLRVTLSSLLGRASRLHQRRKWIRLPYAVTAGDEFQTIATSLDCVPRLLLDLRRAMQPAQWVSIFPRFRETSSAGIMGNFWLQPRERKR